MLNVCQQKGVQHMQRQSTHVRRMRSTSIRYATYYHCTFTADVSAHLEPKHKIKQVISCISLLLLPLLLFWQFQPHQPHAFQQRSMPVAITLFRNVSTDIVMMALCALFSCMLLSQSQSIETRLPCVLRRVELLHQIVYKVPRWLRIPTAGKKLHFAHHMIKSMKGSKRESAFYTEIHMQIL